MALENLSVPGLILLASFALTTVIQLVYYWGLFFRLAFYKAGNKDTSHHKPPVSVVIAARNEYYNLKDLLPVILEQDYPDYEVVVVNHASEDDTSLLLKELKGRYDHLKVVEIEQDLNFFKGKKFPLSIGIKETKNNILLLTDADCMPASNQWINRMISGYYDPKTEIVLGYGPYNKEKSFVNLLVRYDTFMVAMQYLSMALAGKPYMGVGRNLSYQKSLFYKTRGFISHYNISSGDDDLFISQVANKHNTAIELSPESFVYSKPKQSFKEWFKQKRRHLTTSSKYKAGVKFLLGMFSFTQLLFFGLFISLLVLNIEPMIAGIIFLLRFISQIIVHKKAAITLKEGKLCAFSLIWEPFHLLIMTFVSITGMFSKKNAW
jgi:cellulose synthase/poly-beta-1,6-N-acetylglucosamine synthase-like glycosyltransferase